jgi:hypothetical protein
VNWDWHMTLSAPFSWMSFVLSLHLLDSYQVAKSLGRSWHNAYTEYKRTHWHGGPSWPKTSL